MKKQLQTIQFAYFCIFYDCAFYWKMIYISLQPRLFLTFLLYLYIIFFGKFFLDFLKFIQKYSTFYVVSYFIFEQIMESMWIFFVISCLHNVFVFSFTKERERVRKKMDKN